MDGIDAALLKTDGNAYVERIDGVSIPYDPEVRAMIEAVLGRTEDYDGAVLKAEQAITRAHAAAVDWLLSKSGYQPQDVDLIGFHGQTIFHDPDNKFTWQIGNGAMLARLTQIDVINDFRSDDVAAGGQGAPFLPLYHKALIQSAEVSLPVAILNLGGVGNVTYIDHDNIVAFDTGPANALIDDWVSDKLDRDYDDEGLIARQGRVDDDLINKWMTAPYFTKQPPKSLDRDEWQREGLGSLSATDGAATLTEFTVQSVASAIEHLPTEPKTWYVTGGGRHNLYMMERLQTVTRASVKSVDDLGWNGDLIEAEGFAYLAVRSHKNLPLSLPTTTGVPAPQTGGRYHKPAKASVA